MTQLVIPFKCESETMPMKTYVQTYFHTLLSRGLMKSLDQQFPVKMQVLWLGCNAHLGVYKCTPKAFILLCELKDPVLCTLSKLKELKIDQD